MADKSKFYVGLVIVNSKGQVLLGKRREDGIWTGPGGGSEGNETPTSTAVREAFEEAQLEIDAEKLIKLDKLKTGNGKDVHCFLYYTGQKKTSPNLDPDEEVKKWEWFSQEKIPKDLIKDPNRHQAVMNGLMTIKGLKKSQPHKDDCKRHMAEHSKYAELHEKLRGKIKTRKTLDKNYKTPAAGEEAILNALERMDYHGSQYTSLTNKLRRKASKDEEVKKSNKFIAMQDHELHEQYQADKQKEGVDLDKGGQGSGRKKGPKSEKLKGHAESIKNSYFNWATRLKNKPDDAQAKQMVEIFRNKMKDFKDRYGLDKSMLKSLMGIQEGTGVAINTTDQAITDEASQDWITQFQDLMANFNYGDVPRQMQLNRGHSIILTKVDDGLYTGFIKRHIDEDGESELEENVGKVEQSTLADIVQYLKSREYLLNPPVEVPVEMPIEPEIAMDVQVEAPDIAILDRKLELCRLLNGILNGV